MENSVGSASTIRTDSSSSGAVCWGTLTLQNTWLRKTGGSKTLQKRPQTQPVHLLVSSPINTWRHPEREEASTSLSDWFCREHLHQSGGGAYSQKGDPASHPFAQQLVQLFPGDGVGDQAEDEEGGEDDAQSPAQEWVQADTFVVRHISSAWKQMEPWFNIRWKAATAYLLWAAVLLFICCQMPPFISCSR